GGFEHLGINGCCCHPKGEHSTDVGISLSYGDAVLQSGYAKVAVNVVMLQFTLIKSLGKDQVWISIQKSKHLRHHSDDLPWSRIDGDRLSDHGFIPTEPALPVTICQNDRLRGTRRIVGS